MFQAFDRKQGLVLYVLCIAQFTLSADIANLSISTATLVEVLNTDVTAIQVLSTIQPLVGAAIMLSASMLGLSIGWRKLLIAGSGLGFVSTLGFLIFDSVYVLTYFIRPLTGIASALILPSVLALIVAHCPGKNRAIGFGLTAAATGMAAAIIPLLSGWLSDHISWQWSFVLIASCYVVTFFGALFYIKPLHNQKRSKFDGLGSLLATSSIVLLFIGMLQMPHWGAIIVSPRLELSRPLAMFMPFSPAFISFILGAGLFALFVIQQKRFEARNGQTLLPISWFTKTLCRKGFVILALMYIGLGGSSFVVITYLQVALSLSVSHSGSVILLFSVFMIGFSVTTPMVFKTLAARQVCQIAFGIVGISALFLMISSDANRIGVLFYLGMASLGSAMGMLASQCPVIITSALGEREAEQSGGLQATIRNLGLVVGITLFGG